jgi:anti-sigma factor RsiW
MDRTMKHRRDILFQRALDGELTAEEERRFAALLEESPSLRLEFERVRRLRALVKGSREDSFRPFFSSRVINQIRSQAKEESFARALAWLFRRVALAVIILIVALTAYNISRQQMAGNHRSPLEAVLGLPPATVSTSISTLSFTDAL